MNQELSAMRQTFQALRWEQKLSFLVHTRRLLEITAERLGVEYDQLSPAEKLPAQGRELELLALIHAYRDAVRAIEKNHGADLTALWQQQELYFGGTGASSE